MYSIYEVMVGDTTNSIASKFNITPEFLATLNGFNITTNLTPGSYIVVPTSNEYFEKYIVQKGDTIYSVARKYNTNPSDLLKLNGLNNTDYIYPNDSILVPKENVKYYITTENDTLNKLSQELGAKIDDIMQQNQTIYLLEDQLILYK